MTIGEMASLVSTVFSLASVILGLLHIKQSRESSEKETVKVSTIFKCSLDLVNARVQPEV